MSSSACNTPGLEVDCAPTAPGIRANVVVTDRGKRERAPQKWKTGRKVWMRKSSTDTFDYLMYVVESDYDEVRGGWDYQVKGEDGTIYYQWVKETDLKKA